MLSEKLHRQLLQNIFPVHHRNAYTTILKYSCIQFTYKLKFTDPRQKTYTFGLVIGLSVSVQQMFLKRRAFMFYPMAAAPSVETALRAVSNSRP